jgi:hypothetical protein
MIDVLELFEFPPPGQKHLVTEKMAIEILSYLETVQRRCKQEKQRLVIPYILMAAFKLYTQQNQIESTFYMDQAMAIFY